MAHFFNFDEMFRDLNQLLRRIRELEGENGEAGRENRGEWIVKEIDEPGVKGYFIQGRFGPDNPLDPFNPPQPIDPWHRRPSPQRTFGASGTALSERREPLTDVFNEDRVVKIYLELPGEEKEDIRLNVTEGGVEVKADKFYKLINIPGNTDVEKASSKYNNGVLTVTIPKKEIPPRSGEQ